MIDVIANDEPNPKLPPRTKIICTLGPASVEPKVLTEMLEGGMNVARYIIQCLTR
jgi:hypothetical protein